MVSESKKKSSSLPKTTKCPQRHPASEKNQHVEDKTAPKLKTTRSSSIKNAKKYLINSRKGGTTIQNGRQSRTGTFENRRMGKDPANETQQKEKERSVKNLLPLEEHKRLRPKSRRTTQWNGPRTAAPRRVRRYRNARRYPPTLNKRVKYKQVRRRRFGTTRRIYPLRRQRLRRVRRARRVPRLRRQRRIAAIRRRVNQARRRRLGRVARARRAFRFRRLRLRRFGTIRKVNRFRRQRLRRVGTTRRINRSRLQRGRAGNTFQDNQALLQRLERIATVRRARWELFPLSKARGFNRSRRQSVRRAGTTRRVHRARLQRRRAGARRIKQSRRHRVRRTGTTGRPQKTQIVRKIKLPLKGTRRKLKFRRKSRAPRKLRIKRRRVKPRRPASHRRVYHFKRTNR